MFVHIFLKNERERLGLTQAAMAEAGRVRSRTYSYYESGERSPDSEFLASIAAAGADVLYILTGVRSAAAPVLGAEEARAGYSVEKLNKKEQALLGKYRAAPPKIKDATQTLLDAATQRESRKVK